MFEEHGRIVLTGDVAEDGVKALKKVTWAPSCMSTELQTPLSRVFGPGR